MLRKRKNNLNFSINQLCTINVFIEQHNFNFFKADVNNFLSFIATNHSELRQNC